tara:strand:+ start:4787 stop:4939 length:153 start_codon:yes stop_codon:yes gene_type:complete
MSKPRLFDRLDELTILHQASKIKQLETEIKKLKKLKNNGTNIRHMRGTSI